MEALSYRLQFDGGSGGIGILLHYTGADMMFVYFFTLPDFQAKFFTLAKCVICDIVHPRLNSINALNISNLGIFLVINELR